MGLLYTRPDQPYLFQVRRDGFSLSRRSPYQDWETLKAEARRLWPVYKNAAKPEFIELLGLTYVNTLFLPSDASLEEYLRIMFNVPAELPQQLSSLSLSFQVEDATHEAQVRALLNGGQQASDGRSTLFLTIQSFKPIENSSGVPDDAELWATFDRLREVKTQRLKPASQIE